MIRINTLLRSVVIAVVAASSSIATFAVDVVKVSGANGQATYFALADKPVVTFTADYLVLTTTKETVQYPISDYRRFEFVDKPAGITTVGEDFAQPVFSFGNILKGEYLKAGSPVSVYDLSGRLVGSATASATGSVEVDLQGKTGIFIVKTSTKTFKFILK